MENDPALEQHTCKNCGNIFTGYYCNLCGEKILVPADRSFKAFLNSIFLALTLADSRFVKGLWLMVSRPGFLSKEFAEGRKVRYIKPISVFLQLEKEASQPLVLAQWFPNRPMSPQLEKRPLLGFPQFLS